VRGRPGFVAVGYAAPASLSALMLVEMKVAGDLLSVLVFAVGQLWAVQSLRWGVVSGAGFFAGWSLGTGATALAAIAVASALSLASHRQFDDNLLLHVVVPAAGAIGGMVTGATVGAVQLAGGSRLRAGSWIRGNLVGAAPTGAVLALAFVSAGPPAAALCALLGAVAGITWGTIAWTAR
jgi:hypothetical protein